MSKRAAPEEPFDDAPLFASIPPHNKRPTSVHAALSVAQAATALRAKVFECLRSHPAGLTREELEAALGLPGNTIRPRVWELMGNGGHPVRIRESGIRRRTASGRFAEVLVVA